MVLHNVFKCTLQATKAQIRFCGAAFTDTENTGGSSSFKSIAAITKQYRFYGFISMNHAAQMSGRELISSYKHPTIPLQTRLRISTSKTPAFPRGTSGLDTSLQIQRRGQRSAGPFGHSKLQQIKTLHLIGNFICLLIIVWLHHQGNRVKRFAGSPEERPHGNSSLKQHRADQFSQVQPDMRNINGHIFCNLQHLQQPDTIIWIIL